MVEDLALIMMEKTRSRDGGTVAIAGGVAVAVAVLFLYTRVKDAAVLLSTIITVFHPFSLYF